LTEIAELHLKDIDYIAFGWDCKKYNFRLPIYLLLKYIFRGSFVKSNSNFFTFLSEMLKYNPKKVENNVREMCRLGDLEGDIPPIKYINHHLCHAASAFYLSGMHTAHILILDGTGEEACTSVFKLRNKISLPDSLGWFYQTFTEFLGFVPNSHEGKLMGLAAYGKYREDIFDKLT
jgi:carbamoyltransferase